MSELLHCRQLSRFFGDTPVLRGVSFTAGTGEFLALRGPNGAGKSTLLRLVAGALRPSSGFVHIAGVPAGSAAAQRQTGFLSHQSLLHPSLSVEENLRFFATLFQLPRPAEAVSEALQKVRGAHLARLRVGELSQGMKQKAALARSLLHAPRLLLLDEPFASLDRTTVAEMRASLAQLRDQGLTLIVSSHQEEAFTGLADRDLVMERGRLQSQPSRQPEVPGGIAGAATHPLPAGARP